MKKRNLILLSIVCLLMILSGCSKSNSTDENIQKEEESEEVILQEASLDDYVTEDNDFEVLTNGEDVVTTVEATSAGLFDASELFSNRDLKQTADTTDAKYIKLSDNKDITISEAGVYVLSGSAENVTVTVNASEAKVQIVLNGVSVTNNGEPFIYVVEADKVFVTTTDTENSITVSGSFTADGDTNVDAAIFSKEDLTLNGVGTLIIKSSANGVTSKDDLKVTGGTYNITASNHGLEGKDSVRICGGDFVINAGKDGIHSGNTEDSTKGYIYIYDGNFTINAKSDGIQSITVLQIDGGDFEISASEGLESTYVIINGGTIYIYATDDGINGSRKSTAYTVAIEINGGDITIDMGKGDTDALDSNGYLVITGGTLNITAQFAFDYEYGVTFTGGTVYVNGSQVTSISNSMQMGGMGGSWGNNNFGGNSGFGGYGGNGSEEEEPDDSHEMPGGFGGSQGNQPGGYGGGGQGGFGGGGPGQGGFGGPGH